MKQVKFILFLVFLCALPLTYYSWADTGAISQSPEPDERQQGRQVESRTREQSRRRSRGPEQKRKSRFEEMDTDNDGFASLAELLAHERKKFNQKNTHSNRDGSMTLDQYLEDEKRKFLAMDIDRDNRLSRKEMEQGDSRKRQENRRSNDNRERKREQENERSPRQSSSELENSQEEPDAPGGTPGFTGLSEGKVGLVKNTSQAYPGCTLFAPKHGTMTYLIDNAGRVVHRWTGSKYEPGQTVYLLPNGNLLRCCFVHNRGLTRGGEGGRIEEYHWDGNLLWEFNYASDKYILHHDIAPLPNGNILALAVEKKTYKECIEAGFAPHMLRDTELYPDFVIEIEPTPPIGGNIVWEWHVWDHLIQDYDSSKSNFGDVAAYPGRVYTHCNGRPAPAFWNHMNAIAYNETLEQIMLSVRGCSEIWVIDHGTTRKEAAGHIGGKYGKGGDLLYRWGNPAAYKMGTHLDRQLFHQHDAHWIPAGYPGAGNILVFNNGLRRGYSSVMEIVPPVNMSKKGHYSRGAFKPYGPGKAVWTYTGEKGNRFYSSEISGAHRLPNGNTLICAGVLGVFFEVTPGGKTVWKYVNPVVRGGVLAQGEKPGTDHRGHYLNAVFKVHRYVLNYQGLKNKNLIPGNVIRLPLSQEGKTGPDGKNDPARKKFNRSEERTGKKKQDKRRDLLNSLGYINLSRKEETNMKNSRLFNLLNGRPGMGLLSLLIVLAVNCTSPGNTVGTVEPVTPGTEPGTIEINTVLIPGGEFEMGDHHNLGGREHANDEVPIHTVHVDSFHIGVTEVTNRQYCAYLNSALTQGLIEIREGQVYAPGGSDLYCETHGSVSYSRIEWDGSTFSLLDNREDHPMVGVMWHSAAAFCNWLSSRDGYRECYDPGTWDCDFSRDGFRLPTEAEWEYAGRGGDYGPYYIYPWGDDADNSKANWPNSGDPYETGSYPRTTPVGFYNGQTHNKVDFQWPGSQNTFTTSDGSNGYGLYDMAGNVWEWINDRYHRDYYIVSPYDNPRGPAVGSVMPDGKTYRGLRGGNWYNGEQGHSRVSNRNPSYYRGPGDPNHEWYHIGFRVVRKQY